MPHNHLAKLSNSTSLDDFYHELSSSIVDYELDLLQNESFYHQARTVVWLHGQVENSRICATKTRASTNMNPNSAQVYSSGQFYIGQQLLYFATNGRGLVCSYQVPILSKMQSYQQLLCFSISKGIPIHNG